MRTNTGSSNESCKQLNGFWRPVLILQTCSCILAACAVATQPRLEPLLGGKWPKFKRGDAVDVAVAGQHAYVAMGNAGLVVLNVSNPSNCMRVGSYGTGYATSVAVAGNYAYVTELRGWTGSNYLGSLQAIDLSDPTNCVRVASVRPREMWRTWPCPGPMHTLLTAITAWKWLT